MLFYLFEFIINTIKKSFILNLWFIMGFKTCTKQIMELRQQNTCCKKAWDLVLKPCVQLMSHSLLWYNVIRFTLMYIIYFNFHYSHQCGYSHNTLFLCLQMEQDQEDENNRYNKQNIPPNTQSYGSSSSTNNGSKE